MTIFRASLGRLSANARYATTTIVCRALLAGVVCLPFGCAKADDQRYVPAMDASGGAVDASIDAPDGGAGDAPAPVASFDFSALQTYLFGGQWATEGVVVLYNGEQVFEQYAGGYDSSMRHITYSASKSVGSALVGIAVGQGLLKLTDSICAYVPRPDAGDPTYCDTTIESLLQMTSGFAWDENYTDATTSNVLEMLYANQSDMGLYVASFPRAADAGSLWNYSSGDANLLAKALHNALGGADMRAWAQAQLFVPAGMTSAIFETDRAGTLVFSSSCFMTPRDMARFGQLYLGGGSIDGVKVLPSGWVNYSRSPAAAVAGPTPRDPDAGAGNSGGSYGAAWWLNSASASAPASTWLYPEAPVDAYSAEGHWGQKIFVVPSRRLVIARVGNDRTAQFDPGPMVGFAVAAVASRLDGGK